MKIIVQLAPDKVELILNGLDEDNFIVDIDTYCYFRDDVFIKNIEKYIKKIAPGQWQEINDYEGAEKVERWFRNQRLINKYYPKFNKKRHRFYLYKSSIYIYNFLGFLNVTNEIQLIKLEMEDIVQLLNECPKGFFSKILKKLSIT